MSGEPIPIEQVVLSALELVRTPDGGSVADAGVLLELEGRGAVLTVRCRNPGWPDPVRRRIGGEIAAAVQSKLGHVEEVAVEWRETPAGEGAEGGDGPPAFDVRRVVAVGSGKGGVGKSTIAASLAYALQMRGRRVGLMDADVYGPSLPHMLGVEARPGVVANRYQPPIVDGMPVMSMGFLVAPDQAVVWRGPMLHKAVRDFVYSVAWGSLDVLVVDLPPGTGDVVLSLSQQLPVSGGVVVCTPQEVALLDARKALAMFRTVKIPCLGVVENMSYFIDPATGNRTDIFGHGGAERWASEAGVPFLGAVPIDVSVRVHGDEGRLRENFTETCPSRAPLLAVADRLLEALDAQELQAAPTIEVVE